jgi:CheY-like chemotaxis protein
MTDILIVDDNEMNLYQLQVLLEGNGYQVATAANGAEALAAARAHPPALIFTDILMPVMDGFSLCRELKKDPRLKSIPLIFYSATYTDDRDQQFARDLGAACYLAKPVEPQQVLEAIRETLALSHRPSVESSAPCATAPTLDGATPEQDAVVLKQYNEVLVRKLESKMEQLNQANRELERELAERQRAEQRIREQLQELQRWHNVTLGREGRVLELKKEVNELLAEIGRTPRYPSAIHEG